MDFEWFNRNKNAYLAVVLGAVAIVIVVTLLFGQKAPTGPDQGNYAAFCTADAKQCPDGSYVGREGPSCEFKACPYVATPVACTMDAKMCPDGSYVGRVAPNCDWAPCPGAKGKVAVPTNTVLPDGVANPEACKELSMGLCQYVRGCKLCPPCPECSSIGCQSIAYCKSMGFDENWSSPIMAG